MKDMGKVMGIVKSQAAGRADMGAVGASHQGTPRRLSGRTAAVSVAPRSG
ncbi:MAG: hypothetical protein R3E65_10220 [Steroidobacteraceae bacterium]